MPLEYDLHEMTDTDFMEYSEAFLADLERKHAQRESLRRLRAAQAAVADGDHHHGD